MNRELDLALVLIDRSGRLMDQRSDPLVIFLLVVVFESERRKGNVMRGMGCDGEEKARDGWEKRDDLPCDPTVLILRGAASVRHGLWCRV